MRKLCRLLLIAVALALPLGACGKKGDPNAPGADRYPRQYPAPAAPAQALPPASAPGPPPAASEPAPAPALQ